MRKVAVLGSGVVGKVLSDGFLKHGFQVMRGTRAPSKLNEWKAAAGPNESLMERLQALAQGAKFVKAFSCVGNHYMVNPQLPGGPPTMFICGNDAAAKADVTAVLRQFGWDVEDAGAAEGARAIEPLCMLWCIPGIREGRWTHAFRLLRA